MEVRALLTVELANPEVGLRTKATTVLVEHYGLTRVGCPQNCS